MSSVYCVSYVHMLDVRDQITIYGHRIMEGRRQSGYIILEFESFY